jgi:mannose/fructose/N-acetylgalactosamine-specific phosphotransferase system component IID
MNLQEKIWSSKVATMYPKQWIVLVNMEYDKETHKNMGVVYFVTPDKKEAYSKARALGDTMGDTMVVEGFNDTPQIGGLLLWNK